MKDRNEKKKEKYVRSTGAPNSATLEKKKRNLHNRSFFLVRRIFMAPLFRECFRTNAQDIRTRKQKTKVVCVRYDDEKLFRPACE